MTETTETPGDDDPILTGLNAAQRQAVCTTSDCVAILAGPGCGKTHTLTSRVAYLIDRRKYDPRNIIVATFTVKAAREMRERIGSMVGEERQRKIILGTFHSVAARYLSIYGHLIGMPKKFGILDTSEARDIIKRIVKRNGFKCDPGTVLGYISRQKSKGISMPDSLSLGRGTFSRGGTAKVTEKVPGDYNTVFKEYQNYLKEMEMVDYDDLLLRCVQLLNEYPKCVSNVEAVLIDEYQDTNTTQYELLKLFALSRNRITVVGDPDQSIYSWRSAEIKNLHLLLEQYPETEQISLEQNYRSSTKIIDSSMQVIDQDKDRYKKGLVSVHRAGTKPVLRLLESSNVQAVWIAQEITRISNMTGQAVKWKDISVLMRTSSASRLIETALIKEGVRYCMIGGSRFYDRVEIKLIIDYLTAIKHPKNNEAFARVVNVPKRCIGPVTIANLLTTAETSHEPLQDIVARHIRADFKGKAAFNKPQQREVARLVDFLQTARALLQNGDNGQEFNLVQMILFVIDKLGLQEHLKKTYKEDHETRWSNVQELLRAAQEFVDEFDAKEEDLPEIEGVPQLKHTDMLDRFLINISMVTNRNTGLQDEDERGAVTLSTIHAAKGLEWPVVFIPNVQSGSIPFTRFGDTNYPEERRLLYVAMTRAKVLLYLSYPQRDRIGEGAIFRCKLSEFLTSVQTMFSPKGPSFTGNVLSDMGSILRQEFPSTDAVYKGLPEMVSTEDDTLPMNPFDRHPSKRSIDLDDDYDDYDCLEGERKRNKHNMGIGPGAQRANSRAWNPGYSTTMNQSANFTMGFVSASTLPVKPDKPHAGPKSKTKGRLTNDQTRIDSHMSSKAGSSHTMSKTTMASAVQHPPSKPSLAKESHILPPSRPSPINPNLRKHQLGQPHSAEELQKSTQLSDSFSQAGKYPQFSSSPPRPEPSRSTNRHGLNTATKKAPPEVIVIDSDDDVPIDPASMDRPAQTLHKTTMTTSFGGFHRPTGINRLNGPDTVARIQSMGKPPPKTVTNKPFKMPLKRKINKG